MGEVYAAYDPELDRKVAIKLLRVRGEAEGRMRLMREAQAIAKLSHPNVVTIYDVGTFRGDVFIAMQFVDGHTLGYWIHAEPRSWSDVLRVFADAGRGLAAAHAKDLVHRDFKPDNVMVSPDGHVRVMDFGLARIVRDRAAPDQTPPPGPASPVALAALDPDANDLDSTKVLAHAPIAVDATMGPFKIKLTQAGAILGTPAYMAPEQFRGLQADARTDQFSFCVALYEALYGERPFAGVDILGLTAGVLSGAVRDPPAGASVPGRVRKIILRGLKLTPEARWPSMEALLAALEKRGAVTPRRRFAAGAAIKLDGIWESPVRGRLVETPVKAEIRQAFLATGASYAAETFAKVRAILDRYAASWSAVYTDACEATHVRGEQSAEVLDLRMAALQEALDGLRALSRIFRQANRDVVENAVRAASALAAIERCSDVKLLRSVVRPPDDPTIRAEVDRLRAWLADARVLFQVGRIIEGLEQLVQLEREARRLGYAPLLAETLYELATLHAERREAAPAVAAAEEAVWTAELSRHDEVRAKAMVLLVYLVGDLQLRFDAGELWARYADALLRRIGGNEYLWGWLYNNRGAMRERQGRLIESVEDARRAAAVKERVHGPDSADVGSSLGNVAMLLEQLDAVDAAVVEIERGFSIVAAALGPEHPRTGVLLSNYGEILNRVGRFADARGMAARALAIFERVSAPDGVVLSFPLIALGVAYLGDGMAGAALPILERAAAIRDAHETKTSSLGEAHFALARALHETGTDRERALSLARRARAEYAADSPSPVIRRQLSVIDPWLAEHGLAERGLAERGPAERLAGSDPEF
jgi:tetratricopeptide (TPR) repeat protein